MSIALPLLGYPWGALSLPLTSSSRWQRSISGLDIQEQAQNKEVR